MALALACGACLAPPPPVEVRTPVGEVRANSEETAERIATLLQDQLPRVRELLPGSQPRSIDVWVQEELQVYRHRQRPAGIRGFTLFDDEFDAERIHLRENLQSPWYLSHELVHAVIGEDWRPLPGILEEGLADVIAERLNPRYAGHIRAHRLLSASAFTDGIDVTVSYRYPESGVLSRHWKRRARPTRIRAGDMREREVIGELLATSRGELQRDWSELPEPFYGIAWLIVSRIVERQGLEGLHRMCLEAEDQGLDLVPVDRILAAAEMDLDSLDSTFLSSCLGRYELYTLADIEPELFVKAATKVLFPWEGRFPANSVLRDFRPTIRTEGGAELSFRFRPHRRGINHHWRGRSTPTGNN